MIAVTATPMMAAVTNAIAAEVPCRVRNVETTMQDSDGTTSHFETVSMMPYTRIACTDRKRSAMPMVGRMRGNVMSFELLPLRRARHPRDVVEAPVDALEAGQDEQGHERRRLSRCRRR